jgi:hypothetical protein
MAPPSVDQPHPAASSSMTTLLPEVLPNVSPPRSAVLTDSPFTSPPAAAHCASAVSHADVSADDDSGPVDVTSVGAELAVHRSAAPTERTTGRIATPTPQLAI